MYLSLSWSAIRASDICTSIGSLDEDRIVDLCIAAVRRRHGWRITHQSVIWLQSIPERMTGPACGMHLDIAGLRPANLNRSAPTSPNRALGHLDDGSPIDQFRLLNRTMPCRCACASRDQIFGRPRSKSSSTQPNTDWQPSSPSGRGEPNNPMILLLSPFLGGNCALS